MQVIMHTAAPAAVSPLLAPVMTGVGISVSAFLAISLPWLTALLRRRSMLRMAQRVMHQVMGLTIERLTIRYNPALLPSEGPKLRQYRAEATMKVLEGISPTELPAGSVEHFVTARAGLLALNVAMSSEPSKVWPPTTHNLARYRTAFQWASGPYQVFQMQGLGWRGRALPTSDWSPPETLPPELPKPALVRIREQLAQAIRP